MMEPGSIDTRAPFFGESLYGYVADTAGENKLGRVALIAGDADRQYGHRPQLATTGWDSLPTLAELLEVDVAELRFRSYPLCEGDTTRRAFFGTTISKLDLTTTVRRFSPAALAEAPFHRAMWQLRIPFDIGTGEILLSTCSLCGKQQGWRHSAGVAFCDSCGESLVQPADRICADLREDVALAVGLSHTDAAKRAASLDLLPAEVRELGPAMAFELLLRLVPVALPSCTWTSQDRIWHNDPHLIAEGIASAWQILSDWPQAMKARLSADIASASARFSDGNSGATRRFLHLRNNNYLPAELRAAIGRLHESIDLAGPMAAELSARTMTSEEAARELSYKTSMLVDLRREGVFRTIGLTRGPRLLAVFDRSEIVNVAKNVEQKQSLNSVNEDLGLPYYAAEQLCALGHLPLIKHPYFEARFTRLQTTDAAFQTLRDRLNGGKSKGREGDVRLQTTIQAVGGRLKPWDAVIEAMLAGDLAYSIEDGTSPMFRRICVQRDELLAHIAAPITRGNVDTPLAGRLDQNFRFVRFMSKRDAAEVLNLGTNEGTSLLEHYPSGSGAMVPIEDVAALAHKYVASAELTARWGVNFRIIDRAARTVGVPRCEAGYLRKDESRLRGAIGELTSLGPRKSLIKCPSIVGSPQCLSAMPSKPVALDTYKPEVCVCRRSPRTHRVGARQRWRQRRPRGQIKPLRRGKGTSEGMANGACLRCELKVTRLRPSAQRLR